MISTPLFEGKTIRLTGINLESDPKVVSDWTKDLEIARQLRKDSVRRPMNVDEAKQLHQEITKKSLSDGNIFHFMIRPLESDLILGYLRISRIQWTHSAAHIELVIGDQSVDTDLCGCEALELGLYFAFREINLFRLTAVVPEYCRQALRWYEQVGFNLEICRREVFFHQNRYWNALHYGILKSEWESTRLEVLS